MSKRKTELEKAVQDQIAQSKKTGKDPVDQLFLIVDDDEGARQITMDYLRSFGFERIIEAKSADEALEIVRKTQVDFVISDWEMPGKSGLELLRVLKEDPRYQNIPFIIVTSPKSHERLKIEDAAMSHVDGYIIKPFRSQVLREKIDTALVEKSFRQTKGVLVVDDDDEVRSTVVDYVKGMGYSPIFEAKDGEEGFEKLNAHFEEITLVISDWEMPKLAGVDLLKKVRADDKLHDVPFIIITSQSSIERIKIKRAIEADVDHYLLKPFRSNDLRAKVDYVLNRAKTGHNVRNEVLRAQGLLTESRYGEAEKSFQHVLLLDPRNVNAYLGLAKIQIKLAPQKGLEKAMQFIRQALAVNQQFVPAHVELALAFESAMSLEKAINALKDALKLNPLSEEINYHLGRLLLRRGKEAEAVAHLKRALELNPDYQDAKDLLETGVGEGSR